MPPLQLNVHVSGRLVHACTNYGDVRGAVPVLERMLCPRVRPGTRTYSLLLRGVVEVKLYSLGSIAGACGFLGGLEVAGDA